MTTGRPHAERVRLALGKAEQAELNRIIRDRVARAVDAVRAEHARQLEEVRKLHELELAALRLEVVQRTPRHWLHDLMPFWFHRPEDRRDA